MAYEAGETNRSSQIQTHVVNYISDMRQSFSRYGIITFSIVISLFSMSGLPPLVGFIAKINVL